MVSAVALLVLGTTAGLIALWPEEPQHVELVPGATADPQGAEVVATETIRCRSPQASDCRRLTIELKDGPDKGARSRIDIGDAGPVPELESGSRIRVVENEVLPGAQPPSGDRYALVEIDRRTPMLWLAILFCVLVILFGRMRGVLALIGLGFSLLLVVKFVIPALIDGRSPVAVAIVGSFAVMLLTILLAHGAEPKSLAAILGTAVSLLATILIAVSATEVAHLTGFSSEEANLLLASRPDLSLEGLVLAGMVIGALGVLDDVTVSQASTVMALHKANPSQGVRQLYRGALSVGRDHVAATVNTLVLAYVGASLPILLVFGVGATAFTDAISGEAVAEQVVAMLVGSIGLIAAVPVTTFLAATLAGRLSAGDLRDTATHVH